MIPVMAAEYNEHAGARVIRSLDRVLAWHVAILGLWRHSYGAFHHKVFHVHRCCYPPLKRTYDIGADDVLEILREVDGSRYWSEDDVEPVLATTLTASVHPEAVLMGWACTHSSMLNDVGLVCPLDPLSVPEADN